MKEETAEKIAEFIENQLCWVDSYYRKYGNASVITNKSKDIGDFTDENIKDAFSYRHFFLDTPNLWENKRVLDLGCGGRRTKETLNSIYPSVDYLGLDLEYMIASDLVADAGKNLPFKERQFDTITAFGFMPARFEGLFGDLFSGNIKHWRKHLKKDGYFVAASMQAFMNEKPSWYKTIRKSFKILEEKSYDLGYKTKKSDYFMPMEQVFIIAGQK